MSDNVIKVDNLSKKYIISHQRQEHYTALRDVIANKAKGMFNRGIVQPFKRLTSNSTVQQFNNSTEEFYALRDVSFEIKRGDRVGIIGRNGAGKTTLLKLLSRITEPTSGRIEITGRVASLLEVGTGFHPELTGRENIFLNGAILGMSKAEIKKKFDEIVDFAEVEKFLDTPVKRYSSGMYVRLAFAVAAHLEPEILVVDEVLAVGDVAFQKKCMGKMGDVSRREGRTVLFVSHNISAIENLCLRCCVLQEGTLIFNGDTSSAIKYYLDSFLERSFKVSLRDRSDRQGTGDLRIVSFQVIDSTGTPVEILVTGKEYIFRFEYESRISKVYDIDLGFTIRNLYDHVLFRNRTVESGINLPEVFPSKGYFDCRILRLPLTSGRYAFGFRLLVNGMESDYITGGYAAFIDVQNCDYFGTGKISDFAPMVVDHEWRITGIFHDGNSILS